MLLEASVRASIEADINLEVLERRRIKQRLDSSDNQREKQTTEI